MNIILFDNPTTRKRLLPFTFTRPVAEIRVGILTLADKWSKRLNENISYLTESYLSKKFPLLTSEENIYIDGAVCPSEALIREIKKLDYNRGLKIGDSVIVFKSKEKFNTWDSINDQLDACEEYGEEIEVIDVSWKIFQRNRAQLELDFVLLTEGRTSAEINDPHTVVYGKEKIFIEEGADIKSAIINAETGPVYIGKNATIQEGAMIRGACAILENSHVNMGAKLRGDNTIGPYCKVGGEVSNSVFIGYSNKSHDGFLGNSVIGEWCNIGADSNNSNLKNNYAKVKIWSYDREGFVNTEQQFCGLMMGDHTKCAINTMFNTGTVTGVSANIFGAGFPRNFIPSFSWGGPQGVSTFSIKKAFEAANIVYDRRGKEFDDTEKEILNHIFEETSKYRNWEK
ncbi:GlmU family protein [Mangrovivirga cuniculi]|uniref:Glucose-1-phosphate thymidylyltransferase n=1 Tax=Mangrovivirga cuniculi TaxID=2715131 RepID=A0A4D7JZU7_9BACT|nr:GlmU family protein [Mangrovivirga cuniculi]QCK14184.1 glucose-1-phosphate thymidylyltransferase [Mangrovivirga cuniculi]